MRSRKVDPMEKGGRERKVEELTRWKGLKEFEKVQHSDISWEEKKKDARMTRWRDLKDINKTQGQPMEQEVARVTCWKSSEENGNLLDIPVVEI